VRKLERKKLPMIKPTLHHVSIETNHLDDMINWLVVGAKVQFRYGEGAWMSNDDANHRIAFLSVPSLTDDEEKNYHNGMHHCAFEYGIFADLMTSFDRLRKAGVELAFCLDPG
jgi:catechol 2,3-dioxygenase